MTDRPDPHQRDMHYERADTVLVRRSGAADVDDEMDITPMIDVTFLLLIFFMLTSRMDPSKGLLLPIAEHATSVSTKNAIFLTLGEAPDGSAQIYLGNGKQDATLLKSADPVAQDAAITDYVQRTKAQLPGVDQVVVQAERRVKHRDVARVARVAESASEIRLQIAVMEES